MAMKIRPMLDYVKDGLEKVASCSAVGRLNFPSIQGAKPSMVEATGHSLEGHWGSV